jgi:hypothetical protein
VQRDWSQGGIQDLIEFGPHRCVVHRWQLVPPGEQGLGCQWSAGDRPELSHRPTASGDRYLLALGDSVDHLPAMIPQIADRDFGHEQELYHA